MSLSVSVFSVVSHFIVKIGFWNLKLSVKKSLVYSVLNSILTEERVILFTVPLPLPPHSHSSPRFSILLWSPRSQDLRFLAFQLYAESGHREALLKIRTWGGENQTIYSPQSHSSPLLGFWNFLLPPPATVPVQSCRTTPGSISQQVPSKCGPSLLPSHQRCCGPIAVATFPGASPTLLRSLTHLRLCNSPYL